MAAITCPQCKRILNLPDDREIELVSCPMCKHAFAPPSTPKIIQASIQVPTVRIPRFDPDTERIPIRPLMPIEEDEDYPARPDKSESQKALESAAGFLTSMVWIGLLHTVPCCSCLAYVSFEPGGMGGTGSEEFVAFLSASVCAYIAILVGARALRLQSNFRLAAMGVAVALLFTSALLVINVPVVLSFFGIWTGKVPVLGEPCCGVLMIFPSALVMICGLTGGIKGLLALMRPDVQALFSSKERER